MASFIKKFEICEILRKHTTITVPLGWSCIQWRKISELDRNPSEPSRSLLPFSQKDSSYQPLHFLWKKASMGLVYLPILTINIHPLHTFFPKSLGLQHQVLNRAWEVFQQKHVRNTEPLRMWRIPFFCWFGKKWSPIGAPCHSRDCSIYCIYTYIHIFWNQCIHYLHLP